MTLLRTILQESSGQDYADQDARKRGFNSLLHSNVTDRIMRLIANNYPKVIKEEGKDKVEAAAKENADSLTDGWPEDEGFGSSDSYGAYANTLADFGVYLTKRHEERAAYSKKWQEAEKARQVGEGTEEKKRPTRKLLTVKDLKVGKQYHLEDEMGEKFKAVIMKIQSLESSERRPDSYEVQYKYADDSYHDKGQTDWFDVTADEQVFSVFESTEEKKLGRRKAGSWGRPGSKYQKRVAGKAVRRLGKDKVKKNIEEAAGSLPGVPAVREVLKDLYGEDPRYRSGWTDKMAKGRRRAKVEFSPKLGKLIKKDNDKANADIKKALEKKGHEVESVGWMSGGFRSNSTIVVIFKAPKQIDEEAAAGSVGAHAIAGGHSAIGSEPSETLPKAKKLKYGKKRKMRKRNVEVTESNFGDRKREQEDLIARSKKQQDKILSKQELRRQAQQRMDAKKNKTNEGVIEEGAILQSVFDFMWNMAGKIPSVAKSRRTEQLKKEHAAFKKKMTANTISDWLFELESKIKSEHSATKRSSANRQQKLRKKIDAVIKADSQTKFVDRMYMLKKELKEFKKFVTTSNRGVADRKRKLKAEKKLATESNFSGLFKELALNEEADPSFDQADVISKLRASEKSADIDQDTVTFGLQDADGNIIKVHVRSSEAEDFEKALETELARVGDDSEDDVDENKKVSETEIAEVLFILKDKFEIVDIQWGEIPEDEEVEQGLEGEGGDMEGEGDDLEGEDDLGDEEGMDDEMEADGEEESAKTALQQVIDMMKSDSEAKTAEANADKAKYDAEAAKYAAQAAASKVAQEEEILDMEAYNKAQSDADKEAKTLAQLAKYKHSVAQDEVSDEMDMEPEVDVDAEVDVDIEGGDDLGIEDEEQSIDVDELMKLLRNRLASN